MFIPIIAFLAGSTFGYPSIRLQDDRLKMDVEQTVTHLRGIMKSLVVPHDAVNNDRGYAVPLSQSQLHAESIVENNRHSYTSNGVTTNIIVFSVVGTIIVALIVIARAPDWLNRMANRLGFKKP
jgi:hypothetical protein